MTDKLRLVLEVGGLRVPIHMEDEERVLSFLGITRFSAHEPTCQSTLSRNGNGHVISSYTDLTTGDIENYLLEHIERSHTLRSVAKNFDIDIGEGKGRHKSKEQQRAYDKVFRNFITARARVMKRLSGTWAKTRVAGFKNDNAVKWLFKKNETGG